MRILVQAGGFFPAEKYGGPVVSVDNLCTLMEKECEFFLIARDHDLGSEARLNGIGDGWQQRSNCKIIYIRETKMTNETIYEIINDVKPELIYMNSLFDVKLNHLIYNAVKKSKSHTPILMAPRGQLCANAFQFGKYKKLAYCRYFCILTKGLDLWWQSTSDEETQSIIEFQLATSDKITKLSNIPSIPKAKLKHLIKEKGVLRCVFISRVHPKKNLLFAIEKLAMAKSNIKFDIYGPIEDEKYWHLCEHAMNKMPKNINCRYCGMLEHEAVLETFSKYELFVFPTLSENYGHVIAESLLAECPVLISDQTPWNDVEELGVGIVHSLDAPNRFLSGIEQYATYDEETLCSIRKRCKQYAMKKINYGDLKKKYNTMFEQCVKTNDLKVGKQ